MAAPATYVPGVRNLDSAETAQRRRGGWIGVGLTGLLVAAFGYFQAPAPWRLLVALPLASAAIGFLQARSHFCVMVALSHRSPAENASDRGKDRTRALRMIAAALAIGVAGGVIAWLG